MKGSNTYKYLFVFVLILFIFSACSSDKIEAPGTKKVVSVSILPYKYFVEKLAGDLVNVNLMVKPGQSPATYEPVPVQMKLLSQSSIYFKTGHLGFENSWMSRLQNMNHSMKVIDCSEGVELLQGACNHDHGDDHHHHGTDPHIWLSADDVLIQIEHIRNGLVELLPEKRELIDSNYRNFRKSVSELKVYMNEKLKGCKGKGFIVNHPAWGYLARDYGMVQHSMEVDGKNPNPGDVKKIVDIARENGIKSIIIQSQFDKSIAERIAEEIGGGVVMLDPLEENWLQNMRKISVKLAEIVKSNEK